MRNNNLGKHVQNNMFRPENTSFKQKYKELDDNFGVAMSDLKNRLSKLKDKKSNRYYERPTQQLRQNAVPQSRTPNYPPKNTPSFNEYQVNPYYNPNYYEQSFLPSKPIYYPMEPPIQGEPVILPNIQMGQPQNKIPIKGVHGPHSKGFRLADFVVMMAMSKLNHVNQSTFLNDYFKGQIPSNFANFPGLATMGGQSGIDVTNLVNYPNNQKYPVFLNKNGEATNIVEEKNRGGFADEVAAAESKRNGMIENEDEEN